MRYGDVIRANHAHVCQALCRCFASAGAHGCCLFCTAVAIAKEGGFRVCMADWLTYQAKQPLELNDEELGVVAGGKGCQPFAGIL